MNTEKELPNIGTPEQALQKMKNSYQAFLDSSAKFITLAEFYSNKENEGKTLGAEFQEKYTVNYQKLKQCPAEEFGNLIASFTLLYLDFAEDIKENLTSYENLIANGPDKDANEYDQACDYLSIKDEFTDLKDTLNDVNAQISEDKLLETNPGDPLYDYSAK
jgi:hypothetical protein